MTSFNFVARASVGAQARDELSGTSYWINDRAYVSAFGAALAESAADLVTVAMSCYAADRLSPRTVDWERDLQLRIDVADPDRWEAAAAPLGSYLGLLTNDRWSLEFVGGRAARLAEQQTTLFPVDLRGCGAVGLFSGGLDSLAGAAIWLERSPSPLVLLGGRASTVIGRDQSVLAASLREHYGDRVIEVGIPLQLRNAFDSEPSQRTRGFLFLALATAAARTANIPEVVVFENGYGAHNPRLAEHQFGAEATLSTHPRLLDAFAELMRVVELPIRVSLPHRWQTKGELLREMPQVVHRLVAATASCDSYPLRRPEGTHCGRCGSCVLRQQSLLAAGLEAFDRRDYVRRPLERGIEADRIVRYMARQAWLLGELARVETWPEVILRWPSLALGLDDEDWTERAAVLGLMQAYSNEWRNMLEARPRLRGYLRWPVNAELASA